MSSVAATALPATPRKYPVTDLDALQRRFRTLGIIAVGVWLALFLLWAFAAPISGAVVAGGLVKVEANRQTVSHRDGGIVAQVLVRDGQTVRKGQTLIVLEDARVASSVGLLEAQLEAERLRKSRLEAEASFAASWSPDAAASKRAATEPRIREAMAREQNAFQTRRRTLLGQIESVQAQRRDTQLEINAREQDRKAIRESVRLLQEELTTAEELQQLNFVDKSRVRTIRRGVSDYESRVQANEAELAQARQRLSEFDGRQKSLRDAYAQTAAEDLREVTAVLVDVEERLHAGRDTAGRQTIVAPTDGLLVDLKVNTVGSAIGPREAIVDLVPTDAPLVVEVKVGADAVGELRPGLPAEVRLLSYKHRSTGLVDATVTRVSADALLEARSGTSYFTVQVELSPESLKSLGHPQLVPGLAAEVYIKTSERTPFDFLIDPLVSGMRRGFREH